MKKPILMQLSMAEELNFHWRAALIGNRKWCRLMKRNVVKLENIITKMKEKKNIYAGIIKKLETIKSGIA